MSGLFGGSYYETQAYEQLLDGDNYDEYPQSTTYGRSYGEEPRKIKCKHCGKGGFTWGWTNVGWRLEDENAIIHLCLTDKAKAKREANKKMKQIAFDGELTIDQINRLAKDAAYEDKLDRY